MCSHYPHALVCVTRVCLGLQDAEEEERCCGLNARVPRFMCCYPNSQGDGVGRGNLQRRLVWRWGPRERDQPPRARAPAELLAPASTCVKKVTRNLSTWGL